MDQDLIPPANVPSANGPAVPPVVPETTQATTTSTFAPWRTSRRTTGELLECLNKLPRVGSGFRVVLIKSTVHSVIEAKI